jgi:hypothetical protein
MDLEVLAVQVVVLVEEFHTQQAQQQLDKATQVVLVVLVAFIML